MEFPSYTAVRDFSTVCLAMAPGCWNKQALVMAVRKGARHIVTDTEGPLGGLQFHVSAIQDRDGAVGLLASI